MIFETETRIFETLYQNSFGRQPPKRQVPDKWMDQYYESLVPEEQAKLSIRDKKGASKDKPTSMFIDIEKSDLQKIHEAASPEKIQAAEERNEAEKLVIGLKLKDIDLIKEMESWLGTIVSASSRRTYRNGIDKFLKYCELYNLIPMLSSPDIARKFVIWLIDNGASTPTVRSTISSCKKLFTCLLENMPTHPNPFSQRSLFPRNNKRVKPLLVPDQTDLDRLLDYLYKKNLIAYIVIKLIAKYGMRIGAFEKMKIRGKKAVTISKGGKLSIEFDDEDIMLLKAYPLNELKAERLAGIVNYHLKRAYEKGVVREIYSVHDFRHYFAIDFYMKNKDTLSPNNIIYELSKKLGHKWLHTTEIYLESLKNESL